MAAKKKKSLTKEVIEFLCVGILGFGLGGVAMYHTKQSDVKLAEPASVRKALIEVDSYSMKVTAYTPLSGKTALLQNVKVGRDVAVSRDRIDLLGKEVFVLCDDVPVGRRTVNDLTSEDKVNTLDVLVPDHTTAKHFGVQQCRVIPIPIKQ